VSRGLSVTRGVERGVTQVQSSAPACPQAIPVQQRQEDAEHQWPQERQVGWKNEHITEKQQSRCLNKKDSSVDLNIKRGTKSKIDNLKFILMLAHNSIR